MTYPPTSTDLRQPYSLTGPTTPTVATFFNTRNWPYKARHTVGQPKNICLLFFKQCVRSISRARERGEGSGPHGTETRRQKCKELVTPGRRKQPRVGSTEGLLSMAYAPNGPKGLSKYVLVWRVVQRWIFLDNFMCCHTEIKAAHQTCWLTQSQNTDTEPTSPRTDPHKAKHLAG